MRLLDLFCCEGGAGAGYARAGFDVTGVDVKAQRRYPFTFHQADALEYVAEHGHKYDVIHASPPCQAYSITKHTHSVKHPDLLGPTRDALVATGKPYVIENVPGAPLDHPVTLCGASFGLTATDKDGAQLVLRRHRLFESNVWLSPVECECLVYKDRGYQIGGVYGGGSQDKHDAKHRRHGGYTPGKPVMSSLIGAKWMTLHGLAQSIPPAYTAYIGTEVLAAMADKPGGSS
jgi:DNA (cytosine-5)-methyltransferase 1